MNPWPRWNTENGYFRDYDVRKQCYRSVFAGACGVTYGHRAVWQFMNAREEAINYPDRGWMNAMDCPGAFQVGYLRKLMESRPVLDRIPDNTFILKGQGDKGNYIQAFRSADNSYAMIYLPVGKTITVNTASLQGNIIAWWFNPKDASLHKIAVPVKKDVMQFTSPTERPGNDWVIIIEDATKGF